MRTARSPTHLVGPVGLFLAVRFWSVSGRAHVDYVVEANGGDPLAFAAHVLGNPINATLLAGGTGLALVGVLGYVWWRPTVPDLVVLRRALEEYAAFVPWMCRLAVGLPLVGAGFAGYLFTPAVPAQFRLFQVAVGFLVLFGLATRVVALVGLLAYLVVLATDATLLLAVEYVPGFLAIALLGSGKPSADHLLNAVASSDDTVYGRIDPVHAVAARVDDMVGPYQPLVPAVLRVGLGFAFVYLGLTQKLLEPAAGLAVVEKYDLTAVVPVDPGVWVLGVGLAEIGVGVLLTVGLLTRFAAALAFLLLTLTLFGLPDDPVLAHVTLFGLLSAVVTLGAGPASVDAWLATLSADRSGAHASRMSD